MLGVQPPGAGQGENPGFRGINGLPLSPAMRPAGSPNYSTSRIFSLSLAPPGLADGQRFSSSRTSPLTKLET